MRWDGNRIRNLPDDETRSTMRALSFLICSYVCSIDGVVVEQYRMSLCPRQCVLFLSFFFRYLIACVFIEQEPERFRYVLILLCGEFACEISMHSRAPFDAIVPVVVEEKKLWQGPEDEEDTRQSIDVKFLSTDKNLLVMDENNVDNSEKIYFDHFVRCVVRRSTNGQDAIICLFQNPKPLGAHYVNPLWIFNADFYILLSHRRLIGNKSINTVRTPHFNEPKIAASRCLIFQKYLLICLRRLKLFQKNFVAFLAPSHSHL